MIHTGGNSAHITICELQLSSSKLVAENRRGLEEAVLGPAGSARRRLPKDTLTVKEQIEVRGTAEGCKREVGGAYIE